MWDSFGFETVSNKGDQRFAPEHHVLLYKIIK
jgi:hypothetical protein